QMILAAESMRASGGGGGMGGPGHGSGGPGPGFGLGSGGTGGSGTGGSSAPGGLNLWGSGATGGGGAAEGAGGAGHDGGTGALAGLAAQAPDAKPDKPMLLKLAEHVAIRFALDSYEKGELRVNAVKQLLDRMNTEIEGLRKILSTQEEMMAQAGLSVQSYTELLDQEFWEQVPEENKKEVLTSDEAWCVPPRNVRAFL